VRAGEAARAAALAVLLLGALAAAAPARVASPEETATRLFLRALTFDHGAPERSDDELVVAVLFDGTSRESRVEATAIAAELVREGRRRARAGGRTIRVDAVDCLARGALDALRAHTDAAYVARDLAARLPAILERTRRHHIATLVMARRLVELGASIGVVMEDQRAVLLVNLEASRAEGLALSAHLLRVAEVIR
jgi:hypothetical protein